MIGYMWFCAHMAQVRAGSKSVQQQHVREPRASWRATTLGVLLLLATVITTYAAVTG
jgi:hypothetical protein